MTHFVLPILFLYQLIFFHTHMNVEIKKANPLHKLQKQVTGRILIVHDVFLIIIIVLSVFKLKEAYCIANSIADIIVCNG